MTRELFNLKVQRVDLVARAAVRDPDSPDQPTRFLIWKSEDAPVDKAEMDTASKNDLPDSAFAVIKPGGSKDDSGKTEPRDLRMLPHHNASGGIDAAHLRNALARVQQPGTDLSPAERAAALKHLQAHARGEGIGEAAQKSEGGQEMTNAVETPPAGTPPVEPAVKAGESLEERVAKAEAEVKKANERAEEAEKVAKAERETREKAEMVLKAEKEFGRLPGTAKEKGEILFELRKSVSPEMFSKVEAIFKSHEEMAAQSELFKSMGASGRSNGSGSAYAAIEAKAEELRKADPKLSKEQAITKATEQNPDLYRQYRAESSV